MSFPNSFPNSIKSIDIHGNHLIKQINIISSCITNVYPRTNLCKCWKANGKVSFCSWGQDKGSKVEKSDHCTCNTCKRISILKLLI